VKLAIGHGQEAAVKTVLRRAMLIGTAGCFSLASVPATAGTATNTVPAKLKVFAGCSLQARPLMFVATNPLLSVNIDATTSLTVKCTPNTDYSIDIDDGLNPQGNNKRQMTGPLGIPLPYNVYLDGARKNVWGKGQTKNFTGNSGAGSPLDIPVYGRVPASTLSAVGQYNDTLTVTLSF
jgi:spore coat protein U-like protein